MTLDHIDAKRAPFDQVDAWPVGVNDLNLASSNPVARSFGVIGFDRDNRFYMGTLKFGATQTGVMPIEFKSHPSCTIGFSLYQFTASVVHGLRLSFPPVARLNRRGKVNIAVHAPDGAALSGHGLRVAVQVLRKHAWSTVGSSSVSGGVATVSLRLPASLHGKLAWVRAVGSGPNYRSAVSNSMHIRVR